MLIRFSLPLFVLSGTPRASSCPSLAQRAAADRHIAAVVRHAETRTPLRDVTVTAGANRTITRRGRTIRPA